MKKVIIIDPAALKKAGDLKEQAWKNRVDSMIGSGDPLVSFLGAFKDIDEKDKKPHAR